MTGPVPAATPPGMAPVPAALFTRAERDLLRQELCARLGQAPHVADGLLLRIWRTGPRAGQPRVRKAVAGLIARGLLRVDAQPAHGVARARFTPAGIEALRRLLQADRRAFDPAMYAHLYTELDVTPAGHRARRAAGAGRQA